MSAAGVAVVSISSLQADKPPACNIGTARGGSQGPSGQPRFRVFVVCLCSLLEKAGIGHVGIRTALGLGPEM